MFPSKTQNSIFNILKDADKFKRKELSEKNCMPIFLVSDNNKAIYWMLEKLHEK